MRSRGAATADERDESGGPTAEHGRWLFALMARLEKDLGAALRRAESAALAHPPFLSALSEEGRTQLAQHPTSRTLSVGCICVDGAYGPNCQYVCSNDCVNECSGNGAHPHGSPHPTPSTLAGRAVEAAMAKVPPARRPPTCASTAGTGRHSRRPRGLPSP